MNLPDTARREAWASRILLCAEVFALSGFLVFRLCVSVALPPPLDIPPAPAFHVFQPERTDVILPLQRGNFTVYRYLPGQAEFAAHPQAVFIFGSGDGGFDGWEDRVCKSLQADGYEMIGFDCAAYAGTDYTLDILQADMNSIAQNFLSRHGNARPPLILGGWSMGAEQAVPAAGGPHPPQGLTGLLIISPGPRGRYGLRGADRWDVPPTGPGTFALADFSHQLGTVRVIQWDGKWDITGSESWLDSLTAPHKVFDYSYGVHDYGGASDTFLASLKQSLTWILSPPAGS
jgi:hypothetical protein